MKYKIYLHPRCTTCKKAMAFIDESKISVEQIDITQQAPSIDELRCVLNKSDFNLRQMFNTSGQLYRQLGLKDKLAEMTEAEALKLLASNGMLVKRPLVVARDGSGMMGFKVEKWQSFF